MRNVPETPPYSPEDARSAYWFGLAMSWIVALVVCAGVVHCAKAWVSQ